MNKILICLIALFALAMSSCKESSDSPEPPKEPDYRITYFYHIICDMSTNGENKYRIGPCGSKPEAYGTDIPIPTDRNDCLFEFMINQQDWVTVTGIEYKKDGKPVKIAFPTSDEIEICEGVTVSPIRTKEGSNGTESFTVHFDAENMQHAGISDLRILLNASPYYILDSHSEPMETTYFSNADEFKGQRNIALRFYPNTFIDGQCTMHIPFPHS